jgi:Amt family ammonium transporter
MKDKGRAWSARATAAALALGAPALALAADAPVPNKGDNAWMLVSTLLVIMMTVPGLALFYGGLVRAKNILSVLMQVMVGFSLIVVLWCIYGYSLAFSEGSAFIGGLSRLFLDGTFDAAAGTFAMAATFSKGVVIPELLFVAFQATFAGITCCLIVGAFAERMKFSAVLIFLVIWFTFSYLPIAHMVWYWMGPDAYTGADVVDAMNGKAGLLWQWGALDFAGGTVVHINAGVAGLVGAYMVGKRTGYGREAMPPHNLVHTMVGASLLWVGWFGFNAGSALEAGNSAVLAFLNTFLATAAAVVAWTFAEWALKGHPSMLGGASGAVAGLVAITPAAGTVGMMGALVIGLAAGVVCLWGVTGLKKILNADDSLDVFGVHGVGGILGALLTGVFNTQSLGGPGLVTDWVSARRC